MSLFQAQAPPQAEAPRAPTLAGKTGRVQALPTRSQHLGASGPSTRPGPESGLPPEAPLHHGPGLARPRLGLTPTQPSFGCLAPVAIHPGCIYKWPG
ncbi:hypothetical protein GGTG_01475 [Gaeumannomyces tritici R3-111a-1]|uniref:Uncharacterized protein n=1 Tax=Gaeumannomyces tritici (strain R3-111a-1) TaxID=644352 RepID=J3NJP5_GAET3|nr:hypothetical protein GGTG_01475 [Gaeumannomyces tritici R3-111a-1]EJT81497.1 hypothetical protein GGTG_01475 [Gaeumannomyces tritici R3-111a-1]